MILNKTRTIPKSVEVYYTQSLDQPAATTEQVRGGFRIIKWYCL